MWFRNLSVYRLPARWDMTAARLAAALAPQVFVPVSKLEEASGGWAAPLESAPDEIVFSLDGQLLLAWREERRLLPAKVIGQVMKERVEHIEAEEGFRPGRKRLRALKDEVRDELLPRAFAIARDTSVWIDPRHGWLVVDSASPTRASDIFGMLVKAIDRFPAEALKVRDAVAATMTGWVVEDTAPHGFTIDDELELRERDGNASIRCTHQTLTPDEIARHVGDGKQCTRLALTWADRISFVLTDKLEIRRVRALDVIRESAAGEGLEAQERFAADFALMTGELARLLDDLVEALGGLDLARAA